MDECLQPLLNSADPLEESQAPIAFEMSRMWGQPFSCIHCLGYVGLGCSVTESLLVTGVHL